MDLDILEKSFIRKVGSAVLYSKVGNCCWRSKYERYIRF